MNCCDNVPSYFNNQVCCFSPQTAVLQVNRPGDYLILPSQTTYFDMTWEYASVLTNGAILNFISPSQIQINLSGIYKIGYFGDLIASSQFDTWQIQVAINGTTRIDGSHTDIGNDTGGTLSANFGREFYAKLVAPCYITLQFSANSGNALPGEIDDQIFNIEYISS